MFVFFSGPALVPAPLSGLITKKRAHETFTPLISPQEREKNLLKDKDGRKIINCCVKKETDKMRESEEIENKVVSGNDNK